MVKTLQKNAGPSENKVKSLCSTTEPSTSTSPTVSHRVVSSAIDLTTPLRKENNATSVKSIGDNSKDADYTSIKSENSLVSANNSLASITRTISTVKSSEAAAGKSWEILVERSGENTDGKSSESANVKSWEKTAGKSSETAVDKYSESTDGTFLKSTAVKSSKTAARTSSKITPGKTLKTTAGESSKTTGTGRFKPKPLMYISTIKPSFDPKSRIASKKSSTVFNPVPKRCFTNTCGLKPKSRSSIPQKNISPPYTTDTTNAKSDSKSKASSKTTSTSSNSYRPSFSSFNRIKQKPKPMFNIAPKPLWPPYAIDTTNITSDAKLKDASKTTSAPSKSHSQIPEWANRIEYKPKSPSSTLPKPISPPYATDTTNTISEAKSQDQSKTTLKSNSRIKYKPKSSPIIPPNPISPPYATDTPNTTSDAKSTDESKTTSTPNNRVRYYKPKRPPSMSPNPISPPYATDTPNTTSDAMSTDESKTTSTPNNRIRYYKPKRPPSMSSKPISPLYAIDTTNADLDSNSNHSSKSTSAHHTVHRLRSTPATSKASSSSPMLASKSSQDVKPTASTSKSGPTPETLKGGQDLQKPISETSASAPPTKAVSSKRASVAKGYRDTKWTAVQSSAKNNKSRQRAEKTSKPKTKTARNKSSRTPGNKATEDERKPLLTIKAGHIQVEVQEDRVLSIRRVSRKDSRDEDGVERQEESDITWSRADANGGGDYEERIVYIQMVEDNDSRKRRR